MSDVQNRAACVRAPNDLDSGTDGDALVRKYLCDISSDANALPASLGAKEGRYLRIANLGSNAVYYYFSLRSGASATVGATPTAAGVSAAKHLAAGEERDEKLPSVSSGQTWYFVRKTAATSTTVELSLGEGR